MGTIDKRSIPSGATTWRARWREVPRGPQRSKTFTRKIDAQQFLAKTERDLILGTYTDPTARKVTLGEYVEGWVAAQPWRASSADRVASLLRVHILPMFGPRPLAAIRRSDIQGFTTALSGRLAPASVEGVARLLRSILRAAVADGVISKSPADGTRLPRREGVQMVPLTVAEVRRVADAAQAELGQAVVLAASTGLRQGELFGLTVDRFQWARREIVVDRQLVTPTTGAPYFGPCKTARSVRTVPLADHAAKAIAVQLDRYGAGEDALVFHRGGSPWSRKRAADAMRRASAAAEVEATWHSLRHHAASVLIAQGLGVTAVAAVLGHSPAECLKTYAGWWPNEHEAIRAALARAWASESESESWLSPGVSGD
jgi:integrase